MTKTFSMASVLFVSTMSAAYAFQGGDADVVRDGVGERIAEWVRAEELNGFSGSILAARDGEVVAAFGVGSADLAGDVPNTSSTLFEIASATKQFTAAAVVLLAQQNKLSLDDPISKHLPGVPDSCEKITIRHLLQHTSGIPGTNSQGGGEDLGVVLPMFLKGGPTHKPGTHWEYWNQGYSLLSEIIARASGQPYTVLCKERLFTPAGMRWTRFTGDDPPPGSTVATGRSRHGPPRSALEHPYGSYGFQYRGMGGVVTNVWDLWRWDRALRGSDPLSDDAKRELFTPGLNDYALGWFVKRTKSGRLVQSHGGGVRGFVCEVRRYPEDNGCVFVLCNNDAVDVRRVSRAVEAILFGEQPPMFAREGLLDDEFRKGLIGRYKDKGGNIVSVERHGPITQSDIQWSPPNGPVTRAVLRKLPTGDVLIDDGSGMDIKLDIERDGNGVACCLIIMNRRYERIKE